MGEERRRGLTRISKTAKIRHYTELISGLTELSDRLPEIDPMKGYLWGVAKDISEAVQKEMQNKKDE